MRLRPAPRRAEATPAGFGSAPTGTDTPTTSGATDGATPTAERSSATGPTQVPTPRTPLYPRLLGLRHVHPNGWQRAVLGEGMAAVGGLLALADVASAWSALVLPVAVAAVVKGHDLLAGVLQPTEPGSTGTG